MISNSNLFLKQIDEELVAGHRQVEESQHNEVTEPVHHNQPQ